MLQDTIVVPTPADTEVVEITTKKKKTEKYPGYSMWGNGKTTRGGTSLNLLDIVAKLSKAEIALMQFFRDEMEQKQRSKSLTPNVVKPAESVEYTAYLKIAMKKNYAHMECLGILKRLQRGKYVLNPYLYIPHAHIEEMKALWEGLDKSDCREEIGNEGKAVPND